MIKTNNMLVSFLKKEIRIVFYLLTFLGTIGHIVDIFVNLDNRPELAVQNSIVVLLMLLAVFLNISANIPLKALLVFVVYTLIASIFLGYYLSGYKQVDFESIFFRNALYGSFLLSLATLFVNKKHAYLIVGLFILYTLPILIRTAHQSSWTNHLVALILFVAFGVIMYVISDHLEKSFKEIILDRDVIQIQKSKLEELLKSNSIESQKVLYQNKIISRKNAQLLMQGEKLREANETKNKFLSIIAHDLKNPMATIKGFAELLLTRFDTLTDEKKELYVQSIYRASDSLYILLDNLLLWARNQSGKLKISCEKFNVCDALEGEVQNFVAMAQKKEIDLKIEKAGICAIVADKNMITTIVRNLLSNAIKFSYRKSTVILRIEPLETILRISVIDNGTGMDKKQKETIFETRSENRKEGTEGEPSTGLGLSLCQEFVHLHNGSIRVESEPGKGSLFWFEVPLPESDIPNKQ